jgi:hypothetical protein
MNKNSQVAHIQHQQHGAFLGQRVMSGLASDRLVHPRRRSFEICLDFSTAACGGIPKRHPRANGHDLDRDPVIGMDHNAIFAAIVFGRTFEDGNFPRCS